MIFKLLAMIFIVIFGTHLLLNLCGMCPITTVHVSNNYSAYVIK